MLKMLQTLSRSLVSSAEERVEERHALTILNQNVRDAATSVLAAQKAVALVKAQNEQERQRARQTDAMLAALEARAKAALDRNEEALAREAAEAIAVLEDERASSMRAQAAFADEIAHLTTTIRNAQTRLRDLKRGQRVVVARDQVRKVGSQVSVSSEGALTDAEDVLKRIQDRQKQTELADAALAQLTVSDNPATLVDRLARAGCGPSRTTSTEDVLARLRKTSDQNNVPTQS